MRSKFLAVVVAAMVLTATSGCGSNLDNPVSDADEIPTSAVETIVTSTSGEATTDTSTSEEATNVTPAVAPVAPTPDPDGPSGKINNPFRPGVDAANLKNWDVQVGMFDPDAWPELEAFDEFNDPPADGSVYVMVPVTVWYRGDGTGIPWEDVTTLFVDANDISHNMPTLVIPNNLFDIPALNTGETATGNVAFEVPVDDVATGFFTVSYQGANREYFTAVPQA